MPRMAVLREQVVGRHRPPSAGGIKLTVRERLAFPGFANSIYNLPGGFDFVASNKKGRVPGHGFEQQPFVSFRRISPEFSIITEVHANGPDGEAGAGDLAIEPKRDAFIRLQTKRQGVRIELLAALG